MTWKVVNISDTGTGSKFGADDTDKINKLFSGIDVDDVVINADWQFKNSKLTFDNPGQTAHYTIASSAISANRTLTLPLITGDDVIAALNLSQTFTQGQFIAKDTTDLLTLRRDTNTNGSVWELNFDAKDSANNTQPYAALRGEIIDNTSGSEDGKFNIMTTIAGSEQKIASFNDDGDGGFTCGGTNRRLKFLDTGQSARHAFTFPDFDTRLASVNTIQFKYIVTKSGSNTICIDTNGGTIVSTDSDAAVPIKYAVDNAGGGNVLIKRNSYTLATSVNCVGKAFHIYGEGRSQSANGTYLTATHSGSIFNLANTGEFHSGQSFHNLAIDGTSTSAVGIDAKYCIYNFPFLENVDISNCTINLKCRHMWYDTYLNCSLGNAGSIGVKFTNDAEAGHYNGCNTQTFIGGTLEDCGDYDVYAEVCESIQFIGMIIEGGGAMINAVYCGVNSEFVNFDHCDMEVYNDSAGQVIISDHGINNRFNGLRLYNANNDITGIEFTSTSQNAILSDCEFASGSDTHPGEGGTITLDVQSGAKKTNIINNRVRAEYDTTNGTPATTVTVNDNGTDTVFLGNDFKYNRLSDKLEIRKDQYPDMINLYRPVNGNDNENSIEFDLKNSTSTRKQLGRLSFAWDDQTNGSEDSLMYLVLSKAGSEDYTYEFHNDRFECGVDINLTGNIISNTGSGVKIGTGTTQKLGFFNKTPIAQKGANADTSGATLGQLETEVNELKQLLRDYGLMA